MSDTRPQVGEIWQHQKHDETDGGFHQYEIVAVTQPLRDDLDGTTFWGLKATHTETGDQLSISCCEHTMAFVASCAEYAGLEFVIYQHIIPEEHGGKVWARPLDNFCGLRNGKPRFTKVNDDG